MIWGCRKFYRQDVYVLTPEELELLVKPFRNWGEVALRAEMHGMKSTALPTIGQALREDVALMHGIEQILNRIAPRPQEFFVAGPKAL